jgi:hypothetical protein
VNTFFIKLRVIEREYLKLSNKELLGWGLVVSIISSISSSSYVATYTRQLLHE